MTRASCPNDIGLMTYNGYICVALGSYYGQIGDVFKITFEDGQVIEVIKADGKADRDTINGAVHKTDGSVVEFIVDMNVLDSSVMMSGDVGTIYQGKILKIERKNKNVL